MNLLYKEIVSAHKHCESQLGDCDRLCEQVRDAAGSCDEADIESLRKLCSEYKDQESLRLLLRHFVSAAIFNVFVYVDERRPITSDSDDPLEFCSGGRSVEPEASFHDDFSWFWFQSFTNND